MILYDDVRRLAGMALNGLRIQLMACHLAIKIRSEVRPRIPCGSGNYET